MASVLVHFSRRLVDSRENKKTKLFFLSSYFVFFFVSILLILLAYYLIPTICLLFIIILFTSWFISCVVCVDKVSKYSANFQFFELVRSLIMDILFIEYFERTKVNFENLVFSTTNVCNSVCLGLFLARDERAFLSLVRSFVLI